ncbi:MAG: DUF2567 domain-containing protein, partial [Actinomycetota bacterium]|nr:DUF2567 domain-containing protein [Actinomycetota bacterium]
VGLTVGGLLAAVVAWRTGLAPGPRTVEEAGHGRGEGGAVLLPLELRALGVLPLWPLASLLVYTSATFAAERPPRFPVSRDAADGPGPPGDRM